MANPAYEEGPLSVMNKKDCRFSDSLSKILKHGGFNMAFGLLNHRIRDPRVKHEDDIYVIVGLDPETSSG